MAKPHAPPKETEYFGLPMLEMISHNPDVDIASCRRLQEAGFGRHA